MKKIVEVANTLLKAGESFAMATIVTQKGNTPRHAGAQMLVKKDGSIAGTVGGGLLEAETRLQAAKVIAEGVPYMLAYELRAKSAAEQGMVCGGEVEVWIDYVDAGEAAYRAVYQALADVLGLRKKAWLGFYLPEGEEDPKLGMACRQCLILADGTVTGPFQGEPGIAHKVKGYDVFTLSETSRIFLQQLGNDGRVLIFGAGHVGEKLVPVLTSVGFETIVMDDRAEFANEKRYPTADGVRVISSYDEDLLNGLGDLSNTYCVIVTRGHLHDKEVLAQCLRTDAYYVGMIGSLGKRKSVFNTLREEGFSDETIARCYSPIGTDIGAETPEEIAISIAGELIAVRAMGHEKYER